jgi:hypothetical protein
MCRLVVTHEVRGAAWPVDKYGAKCELADPTTTTTTHPQQGEEEEECKCFGGAARRATTLVELRAAVDNHTAQQAEATAATGEREGKGEGKGGEAATGATTTPNPAAATQHEPHPVDLVLLDTGAFFSGAGPLFPTFQGNASARIMVGTTLIVSAFNVLFEAEG